MSRQDDKRIAALVKKNTARIAPKNVDRTTQYDDTLRIRPDDDDQERKRFFKEMKRREF